MNRWTSAGLLGTLLLVPGCGTMGLMTRSSYSTIRDPFLEGAEDRSAGDRGDAESGDLAGRVAVDADPAGPAPLPGSAGRASLDSLDASSAGPAAATAVYPADGESEEAVLQTMKGPALAGFLRTGRTPDGRTGAAVIGDSGAGVRSRTSGGNGEAALELPRAAALVRQSPAAEAAAMNAVSSEVDGFSSFLATGPSTTAAAGKTAATSSPAAAEDFSEFASRRQAEWKQKPAGKSGVVQTSAVAESPADTGTRSERMKTLPAQPAGKASELNPFEDLPAFDTVEGSAQQQSGAATFDETFGGKADWKPAEFEP
jgi:hypothetical protein